MYNCLLIYKLNCTYNPSCSEVVKLNAFILKESMWSLRLRAASDGVQAPKDSKVSSNS